VVGLECLQHGSEYLVFKTFHITLDVIEAGQVQEQAVAGFVLYFFRPGKFQVLVILFYPGISKPALSADARDPHLYILAGASESQLVQRYIMGLFSNEQTLEDAIKRRNGLDGDDLAIHAGQSAQ